MTLSRALHCMSILAASLAAAALLPGCASKAPTSLQAATASPPVRVDANVASKYDAFIMRGDPVGLIRALRADRSPGVLLWLEQKAAADYPPAQFELADRLIERDSKRAMALYASAKLARFLDGRICRKSKPDLGALIELNYMRRFAELEKVFDEDYGAGLLAATQLETARSEIPDYRWMCDTWEPLIDREPARRKLLLDDRHARAERLRDGERGRIASKLNTKRPINPARYKTITPQFASAGHAIWLDNDRLYTSRFRGAPARRPSIDEYEYVIWNVNTGGVLPTRDRTEAQFCVNGGNIGFGALEGDYLVFYFGAYGQEQEIDRLRTSFDGKPIPQKRLARELEFSNITCRPYDRGNIPSDAVWSIPLREVHGYILRKRSGSVFVKASNKTEVPLGIDDAALGTVSYLVDLDAYMFINESNRMSSSIPRHILLLWPEGRLDERTLHPGPWFGAGFKIKHSRAGFIVSSDAVSNGDGNSGLYLVSESKAQRLAAGYPQGFDVSPNGCFIAFGAEHRNGADTLQVFNVCAKE